MGIARRRPGCNRNFSRRDTPCDLFVLSKADFERALKDHPQFAGAIREAARARYAHAAE